MSNNIWVVESPLTMIEGEEIAFSLEWSGAAVVEDPSSKVYQDGVEITESVMVNGDSDTASGNVQTIRRISAQSGDGGGCYVVEICANVDNNIEKRKLLLHIIKPGDEG